MPARIQVGSCSWTDPTLIACGRFYPPGITSAEARLRYYAEQFDIVEVDSTYYAPPSPRNSELWAARTPAGFVFNIKAFGLLTHHPTVVGRLPDWLRNALPRGRDQAERLRQGLPRGGRGAGLGAAPRGARAARRGRTSWAPSCSSSRPGSCAPTTTAGTSRAAGPAARLAARGRVPRRRLDGRGVRRWHAPAARGGRACLRGRRRAAGVPEQHAAAGRGHGAARGGALHGRNAGTWESRTGAASDRFKYLYADGELEEWVPRVRELAAQTRSVHVLFNNNYEDWGMQNARRMAHLLGVGRQPPQTRLAIS